MTAPKALVLLAAGAEEMEVVITVDVLRRGGVTTVLGGLGGFSLAECSRGVKLFPDALLDDALKMGPFDIVIIPGGLQGAETLAASEKVGTILREQQERQGWIAAICAGPLVLDRHDIGKGNAAQIAEGELVNKITSHPSVADRLAAYEYCEKRVCVSNQLITSRGPGTAFEFALAILDVLQGPETVAKVSEPMILAPLPPEESVVVMELCSQCGGVGQHTK